MPDYSKLKELAELKESGVLNEAEFAAEKEKILAGADLVKGTPVENVPQPVKSQPQAIPVATLETAWNTGFYDCFGDIGTCEARTELCELCDLPL